MKTKIVGVQKFNDLVGKQLRPFKDAAASGRFSLVMSLDQAPGAEPEASPLSAKLAQRKAAGQDAVPRKKNSP